MPGHRLGQRPGESRPVLGPRQPQILHGDLGRGGVHPSALPVLGDGERLGVQSGDEGGELVSGPIDVSRQRAVLLAEAVLDVLAHPIFPTLGLSGDHLRAGQVRLFGAVQGGAPDVGREELGIGRPDQGPVGVADVRQFPVSDGGAQDVEVAGRVPGAHVVDEIRDLRVLAALGRDGLPRGHDRVPVIGAVAVGLGRLRAGRRIVLVGPRSPVLSGRPPVRGGGLLVVARLLELLGTPAGQTRRLARAARIETDDVVGGEHLGGVDARRVRGHGGAGLAGAARIEEQASELGLAVGGGQALEGDRDGPPGRVVVVHGYGGGGALEAGRAVRAIGPAQVLTVEVLQALGRGRSAVGGGRRPARYRRARVGRRAARRGVALRLVDG